MQTRPRMLVVEDIEGTRLWPERIFSNPPDELWTDCETIAFDVDIAASGPEAHRLLEEARAALEVPAVRPRSAAACEQLVQEVQAHPLPALDDIVEAVLPVYAERLEGNSFAVRCKLSADLRRDGHLVRAWTRKQSRPGLVVRPCSGKRLRRRIAQIPCHAMKPLRRRCR